MDKPFKKTFYKSERRSVRKDWIPSTHYKWHDPKTGNNLSAGGVLFYDEEGIWTIGERKKSYSDDPNVIIAYTDIGGKYTFEDGNIYTTIRRELYEETYGLCDMLVSEIMDLAKKCQPIYINGHNDEPCYMCIPIPLSAVKNIQERMIFDPVLYLENRKRVLEENHSVMDSFYPPFCLKKFSYKEIETFSLSYRLRGILNTFLKTRK